MSDNCFCDYERPTAYSERLFAVTELRAALDAMGK